MDEALKKYVKGKGKLSAKMLTKREYFAIRILSANLTDPNIDFNYIDKIIKLSVNIADKLIAELRDTDDSF